MRLRVVQVIEGRIRNGQTQVEIAAELETKQSTVAGWKQGRVPDVKALARIAITYNLSGHWLLTGQLPMEPPGVRPDLQAVYAAGWASAREAALRAVQLATAAEDAARRGGVPPVTGQGTTG